MSIAGQTPRDYEAREQALDPRHSFIVQAPAGAGKTGLLIQRYLSLLAHVERPEEVLAITFTRKATAEMRARVLDALDEADRATERPSRDPHHRRTVELARAALARDRQLGWQLVDAPSRLRVLTIDALCLSLARQLPVSTGLGVPSRIVEDAGDLYRRAVRDLLDGLSERAPWCESLVRVLAHVDNDLGRFEQMVVQMLGRRDQWLAFCAAGGQGASRERLEAALGRAVAGAMSSLRARVPSTWRSSALRFGESRTARGSSQHPSADRTSVGLAEEVAHWQALATALLTDRGDWRVRFPAGAEGALARQLADALAGDDELRDRLHRVRSVPPPAYDDGEWAVLGALLDVLRIAAGLLQVVFAETASVDFIEITAAARRALGQPEAPTDLALAIDYRLGHILVDEFQDTSHTQVELLNALTAGWASGDGRTLFLVGDPMQSIYRFREADVGLFLRAWDRGMPTVELDTLRLESNFRASPELVAWANRALPHALTSHDSAEEGAVAHRPARAVRDSVPEPAVVVHAFDAAERASEGVRVAELVVEARAQHRDAIVAVLVRTRTHLDSILPALEAAGIPVRGVDIEDLESDGVVQDLLALSRALLHPADRIAWLSVLRAPWCGLTLDDLHRLAGDDHEAPLLNLIADPGRRGALSEDGAIRCERVADTLLAADRERSRWRLRRQVQGVWYALGGPAFARPEQLERADRFFQLLDELESGGGVDAAAVTRRVRVLFAAPSAREGAVDVMTIHKAKGLEFDVVIVPGLDRVPRREERRLLAWSRIASVAGGDAGEDDLLIAPLPDPGLGAGSGAPIAYRFARQLAADKLAHECGRLLYVAVTRARRQLHLLARVRAGGNGRTLRPPAEGSLLARLWPRLEADFAAALDGSERPAQCELRDRHEGLPVALRRGPRDWHVPPPPPSLAITAPGLDVHEEPAEHATVEFYWASELARHVGTVVHRTLHEAATEGLGAWQRNYLSGARAQWRGQLRGLGVDGDDLDAALARVEETVSSVIGDERARWLLDPQQREQRSEHAIGGYHRGAVVRAVIDRTFVDEHGVRWIVDYKSGRHEGGDIEGFLDRECERYRPQLERYAELMSAMDDHPIRLGLYFPALRGWREWGYQG